MMGIFILHLLDANGKIRCGLPMGSMQTDDNLNPCADCLNDLDSVWVDVPPTPDNPIPTKIKINRKGAVPKGKEQPSKKKDKPPKPPKFRDKNK